MALSYSFRDRSVKAQCTHQALQGTTTIHRTVPAGMLLARTSEALPNIHSHLNPVSNLNQSCLRGPGTLSSVLPLSDEDEHLRNRDYDSDLDCAPPAAALGRASAHSSAPQ